MNKNEMLERLDALEKEAAEMRTKLSEPEVSKEQRFLDLLTGCEIRIDKKKYPDSVFFRKGGKIFFEIEKTKFWCSYYLVWAVFEKEYSMDFAEIQVFIKDMMEEHLKMGGDKTSLDSFAARGGEHF